MTTYVVCRHPGARGWAKSMASPQCPCGLFVLGCEADQVDGVRVEHHAADPFRGRITEALTAQGDGFSQDEIGGGKTALEVIEHRTNGGMVGIPTVSEGEPDAGIDKQALYQPLASPYRNWSWSRP